MNSTQQMEKGKLKFFGQIGFRFLFVLLATPALIYIIVDQLNKESHDNFYLYYASALLLATIIAILYDLIKKVREVEIRNEALILENKITGKIKKYLLTNIKGYEYNGLSQNVYILNYQDDVLTKIYEPFYIGINNLLEDNGIKYLGRSKSLFSK